MKTALLILALLSPALGGGEHERGVSLLAAGDFAGAVEAFKAAIATDGEHAELCYNLALALWRSGEADEAETWAEKAATLSDGAFNALRDGLLGNLRFDAAKAKFEAGELEPALGLAKQARRHHLRGALRDRAPTELSRNLERSEKLIDEIEKAIEEQKKQEEEQKKQDDQQKQDQEKNEDQQKQDDQQKNEDKQQDQQPPKDQQPGDEQQEPKPDDQQQPEQQPGDQEQPKDEQQPPAPAPGEQPEGKELTEEEKKRLLDQLEKLQEKLMQIRAQQQAARPKVEKDW